MSENAGGESPVVDAYEGSADVAPTGGAEETSSGGLADALKAAEAALGPGEDDSGEPEIPDPPGLEEPKAEAAPEAQEEPAEATEENLSDLEKALQMRRDEAKEKLKAREELDTARQEFLAEKQQFESDRAELNEAVSTIHQLKQLLRTDPAAFVQQIGIEPEKFVADLANLGSHEQKSRNEFDALRQEIAGLKDQLTKKDEYEAQQRQQAERARFQQVAQQVESDFVAEASGENYPTLRRFIDSGRAYLVVAEAHDVAERYYQAAGKAASYADIAEYLEAQYSSALGLQEQPQTGKPPQGKRGAVTLGSIQPERSPGYEPSKEDSDDEALKKAIAATRAGLKSISAG